MVEYYCKTEACISPDISHWFRCCNLTKNNHHIVAYVGLPLQRIRNFLMLVPQQLSIWIACNDPAADSALCSFHRTLRSFQKLFFFRYEIHSKKNWWLWLCDGVLLLTVHMQYRKNGKWKRIKDEVLCSFSNCALSKFLRVWVFSCLFAPSVK